MTTPSGPRSGDGTCDLIDDALCQLAERQQKRPGGPLTTITLLTGLINQAERMTPEHVLIARDHGATGTTSPHHQHRTDRTHLQPPVPQPSTARWPYDC
ncbi:MAG TPA: hypothetical protein VGI74_16360 [Streptosporangiaceae bacterium]|jgi:hypothetical protein